MIGEGTLEKGMLCNTRKFIVTVAFGTSRCVSKHLHLCISFSQVQVSNVRSGATVCGNCYVHISNSHSGRGGYNVHDISTEIL